MINIILPVLTWWTYGMPVVFVVYGIYVATDSFSYEGMLEITLVAIFWPFVLIHKVYEWWRY